MDTEATGSGGKRVAGKQLPEKRQGFVIYLPVPVHRRLKRMAQALGKTMAELATTGVVRYLEAVEIQPTEAGRPPHEAQPARPAGDSVVAPVVYESEETTEIED